MTNEQKLQLADKVLAQREKSKLYSIYRNARINYEWKELKTLAESKGLTIKPFMSMEDWKKQREVK